MSEIESLFIGRETRKIEIITDDKIIKQRILSYRHNPQVKILSKKNDPLLKASIPVSYVHIIAPRKPWEDIIGCLSEECMPDFEKIEKQWEEGKEDE